MDTIGAKLRKLREGKRFSQEEVADKLGVSQATYSRLECGQSKLTMDMIPALSQLYEIEGKELL